MYKVIRSFLLILFVSLVSTAQPSTSFYQDVNWTPDGKRLSFSRITMKIVDGKRDFSSRIYTIAADGTDEKQINVKDKNVDDKIRYFPTVSNSMNKIAFTIAARNGKTSDVFAIKYPGETITRLTKNAGKNTTAAYSPDGGQIAFVSTRDGGKHQIYTMKSDGTNATRLTSDVGIGFYNPMWSPDGKKIVFFASTGNRLDQIWIMNSYGREKEMLTKNIGHNTYPAFLPDGKKIVFTSNRDGMKGAVYTIDIDGTNLRYLGIKNATFARFSPDGKKIALIIGKIPRNDVYIANYDGTEVRKLINQVSKTN